MKVSLRSLLSDAALGHSSVLGAWLVAWLHTHNSLFLWLAATATVPAIYFCLRFLSWHKVQLDLELEKASVVRAELGAVAGLCAAHVGLGSGDAFLVTISVPDSSSPKGRATYESFQVCTREEDDASSPQGGRP